jgi:hypothetical protein
MHARLHLCVGLMCGGATLELAWGPCLYWGLCGALPAVDCRAGRVCDIITSFEAYKLIKKQTTYTM